VIVVDAGGETTYAIVGDLMSSHAEKRGVAGFVIYGAIRDSAEIGARRFPVYACGVTHRGPYKNGPGEINVPIALGSMVINPGDIIVGDTDGVVAVPQAHAGEILALARVQLAKETATLKAIARGKADRRWVDDLLRQRGCDF
jgi:regulator of RNase E activity RraA